MSAVATELSFGWNGLTLAGSLHQPAEVGPHPVVLMLQGSGPTDRDCGDYFGPIRRTFLDRGVGTFSFDKPGCGTSTGDWRRHALEARADQAATCLDVLFGHHDIDETRVGVWGHSQGGWLAQMLAARRSDLAFAVANSGPSIGVAEQDLYGCDHTMRDQARSPGDITEALMFMREVHRAAADGEDYDSIDERLLRYARQQPWYGYLTIDGAEDWELVRLFMIEQYDPVDALQKVRCPFLAVYGGGDLLVPAWKGAEQTGRALQSAPTRDSTVVVFPDGNHRIQDPESGRFVVGYLSLLGDWVATRIRTAPA